jgi:hypothetical protein
MKVRYLVFGAALLLLALCGCQIKEWQTPTWDVDLNVPLINKKFFVRDLAEDSVNFYLDGSGGIYVQAAGDFETNPLDDIPVTLLDVPQAVPLLSGTNAAGSLSLSATQDSIRLSYGVISEGAIRYNFSGMSASVTSAYIIFPEFKNSSNIPLTISYNTAGWHQVDLNGYYFGAAGSNTIINELEYELHVTSTQPNGANVGNLQIEMDGDVLFSFIRGRVSAYRIVMEESEAQVELDYPEGMNDAINMTNASITAKVYNPFSFGCLMSGQIYGTNEEGEHVTYTIPQGEAYQIHAVNEAPEGYTEVEFTGPQVNDLLQIMPTHVELRNAFFEVYNPNNLIGEMNSAQVITGTYTVRTPFTLEFMNKEIIPRDSVEISIDQANIDYIQDNVNDVQLSTSIINQLPVGGEITLYFSYTDPDLDPNDESSWQLSKSIHIYAMATPNPAQEVDINLSDTEVDTFAHSVVYMRMKIRFDNSNGPVTITATEDDYIHLRAMLKVNAHVEEP